MDGTNVGWDDTVVGVVPLPSTVVGTIVGKSRSPFPSKSGVGTVEGMELGDSERVTVGFSLGVHDGETDGTPEGDSEIVTVGFSLGGNDGENDGIAEGDSDRVTVGFSLGATSDGNMDGTNVGRDVTVPLPSTVVGTIVGRSRSTFPSVN